MTKKETIYNALGIIEGAVCVSQKNTRDALMKAIKMIKDAVEEDAEFIAEAECDCDHKWELVETWEHMPNPFESVRRGHFVCKLCGKSDVRNI